MTMMGSGIHGPEFHSLVKTEVVTSFILFGCATLVAIVMANIGLVCYGVRPHQPGLPSLLRTCLRSFFYGLLDGWSISGYLHSLLNVSPDI